MAPLIDRIEAAFIQGRESWRLPDCVDTEPLLRAMEVYGIHDDQAGDNEAACMRAFAKAREKFGREWWWMNGDVAELICGELLFHARVPLTGPEADEARIAARIARIAQGADRL